MHAGVAGYDSGAMPERPRKRPADLNRLAASIVEDSTSEEPATEPQPEKNPAAVELGRRGGLKGGRARAERMTAEERRESAERAARARWQR